MTKPWLKNSIKNLTLLVVSLTVVLLLSELAIRLVLPQQLIVPNPKIWRSAEVFGWRNQENANTTTNTGEGPVRFVSDSNGYRINITSSSLPAVDSVPSIIFLGDSFLQALQVENREAIPEVIRRLLAEQDKTTVVVANGGVDNWNPNHYLLESGHALTRTRYDLGVVLLYVANDIVGRKISSFSPEEVSEIHDFRLPSSFGWRDFIDAFLYPVNDLLETNSHLFVLFKNRTQTLLARLGLTATYFPSIFELKERDSGRWQTTTEICRDIEQTFALHGAEAVFVLIPAPYQVYDEVFHQYVAMFDLQPDSIDIDQPNKILAELFAADSLQLLDPLAYMRQRRDQSPAMYGSVDQHFTTEGHRLVAEFILPIIREKLVQSTKGQELR